MTFNNAIGVFDSGFGGLTVFKSIVQHLPDYDYIYLGDNARSPYGDHSFDTVYQYTLEAVEWLFAQGCPLVILACNTASAKALRNIQQKILPVKFPDRKVLGVIRPTAEIIGNFSKTKSIGVLGTRGTVKSESYLIEIENFFPEIKVTQQSCPMWVPLIENNEHHMPGADYYVKQYLDALFAQNVAIDTILLACTHYPLLIAKIEKYLAKGVNIIAQGDIVAQSLIDYLKRHGALNERLTKNGNQYFYTTGDTLNFNHQGSIFLGKSIKSQKAKL